MKRALLRGEISYSSAKDKEVNILQRLEYPEKQNQFITDLINREQWIKGVVAHHLNITPSKCHVADSHRWLWGSFNLCIPITIHDWIREQPGNQVLLRLPLPYKVGEAFRPGNIDEKIRCEASTYAWLEENHPHIPIPRLYGFSLLSGESVSVLYLLYIILLANNSSLLLEKTCHSFRNTISIYVASYTYGLANLSGQYLFFHLPIFAISIPLLLLPPIWHIF